MTDFNQAGEESKKETHVKAGARREYNPDGRTYKVVSGAKALNATGKLSLMFGRPDEVESIEVGPADKRTASTFASAVKALKEKTPNKAGALAAATQKLDLHQKANEKLPEQNLEEMAVRHKNHSNG